MYRARPYTFLINTMLSKPHRAASCKINQIISPSGGEPPDTGPSWEQFLQFMFAVSSHAIVKMGCFPQPGDMCDHLWEHKR